MRLCRCVTHVSNCDVRKFIFLSLGETHVLLDYFVVDRTCCRSLPVQKNVGRGLRAKDVSTGQLHGITLHWCQQLIRRVVVAVTFRLVEKHAAMIGLARAQIVLPSLLDDTVEARHGRVVVGA